MEHSLEQIDVVVKEVAQWSPFSARFLKKYFRGLKFEFGEDYQRGYLEFLRRAHRIGAIDTIPQLMFVDIP
jgi:predicted solute-binding protein